MLIILLCLSHLLIDLISAGMIYSIVLKNSLSTELFFNLVIIYNIFAFGGQIIIGLLSDRLKKTKWVTASGFLLALLALLLYPDSYAVVIFIGIANALVHVGAGSIILNYAKGKAFLPGVFVAPGAIGLVVGGILARQNLFVPWVWMVATIAIIPFLFFLKEPNYLSKKNHVPRLDKREIVLILILLTIVFRSIIGLAINYEWKAEWVILFSAMVFLGKFMGGYLADRFGFFKTATISLFLSLPLIYLGNNIIIFGLLGICLFQITMPITLSALSRIFPHRPGFVFGLNCLALLIGALLSFSEFHDLFSSQIMIVAMIISSIVFAGYALKGRIFATK